MLGPIRIVVLVSVIFTIAGEAAGSRQRLRVVWRLDNLQQIAGHAVTTVGEPRVVDTRIGRAVAFDGRGAVVVSCDENASRTGRLAQYTRLGDVLVVAAGVPGLVGVEHVQPGAVVIDVGINPVRDPVTGRTRLVGDVDPAVASVARAVTPVPGGVGPVTDVWLVQNTVLAAEAAAKRR